MAPLAVVSKSLLTAQPSKGGSTVAGTKVDQLPGAAHRRETCRPIERPSVILCRQRRWRGNLARALRQGADGTKKTDESAASNARPRRDDPVVCKAVGRLRGQQICPPADVSASRAAASFQP